MEQSGTFNGSQRRNHLDQAVNHDLGCRGSEPEQAQIAPAASLYSEADSAAYTPRLNWNVLSATVTT